MQNNFLIRNLCYPEVYYKVQPFVTSVCDEMDCAGEEILSQEMFDEMSGSIYNKVRYMHPELVEYASCHHDMRSSVESLQRDFDWDRRDRDRDRDRDRNRDRDFPRFRFRRRGIFRDFIELLLLNELFGRGRIIF